MRCRNSGKEMRKWKGGKRWSGTCMLMNKPYSGGSLGNRARCVSKVPHLPRVTYSPWIEWPSILPGKAAKIQKECSEITNWRDLGSADNGCCWNNKAWSRVRKGAIWRVQQDWDHLWSRPTANQRPAEEFWISLHNVCLCICLIYFTFVFKGQ